jgi:hypothetical protein
MAPAADLVTKSPFKLGSDLASCERNTSGLGCIQQYRAASTWRRVHWKSRQAAAQNFQFRLPQTDGQGTKIGAPIGGSACVNHSPCCPADGRL